MNQFLKDALNRHLDETMPIISQLDDLSILKVPYEGGRPIGDIVLHMIRSLEFYLTGLALGSWKPLSYSLEEYSSGASIKKLAQDVFDKARNLVDQMDRIDLSQTNDSFSRPATLAELMLEVIEHSIHHRGQLTVYYRLLGIDVPDIQYIV